MVVDRQYTKTSIERLPSSLGDVILQGDCVARDGAVVKREITMFVPSVMINEGMFDDL